MGSASPGGCLAQELDRGVPERFSQLCQSHRVSWSARVSCSAAAVTCSKKKKLVGASHTQSDQPGQGRGALRAQLDYAASFAVATEEKRTASAAKRSTAAAATLFEGVCKAKGSAAHAATGWQSPSGCCSQPAPLGPAEHPFPSPHMQMGEHLVAGTYKDSPQLSKYGNRVSAKLSCS